jgi:hypothetical protein
VDSYREKPEVDPREDELVTVATYVDLVEAEMARADLSAIGVRSFVFEPTGYGHTAGGIRLMVRDADAGTAQAHLADQRRHAARALDDDDDPNAVRCPRCELAYTSYGRPKLWTPRASSSLFLLVFFPVLALLFPFARLFMKKCYRCEKCLYAWDDPKAGPKQATPLAPDDPRPVFRLRRGSPGLGLFLGSAAASLFAMVYGQHMPLLVLAGAFGGWLLGRSMTRDICSEPSCRAQLPPDASDCPSCHGTIAGVIQNAHEHYVEAAAVRRELAAAHEKPAKKKLKRASAAAS